jgi:hypothetical protein
MTIQLRRYVIHKDQLDSFLAVWSGQLVPLREKYGFRVIGAWVTENRNEFVWLVTHGGDFAAAEKEYYASPERADIRPNPSTFVAKTEVSLATSVLP